MSIASQIMKIMNTISCYHYRAVEIRVGERIPPTCTQDYSVPKSLWTVPMVWFLIGDKDLKKGYDPYGADPRWVHRLELKPENICRDFQYPDDWGYTLLDAIVVQVWSEKNPWVFD